MRPHKNIEYKKCDRRNKNMQMFLSQAAIGTLLTGREFISKVQ